MYYMTPFWIVKQMTINICYSPITGQVTARAFAFAFIADTCVVGFLLVAAFLFFHVALMLRGQTTREWYSTRQPYNLGALANIRECLGKYWYISWLCPLIPSPLPGDGINFKVTGSLEPMKYSVHWWIFSHCNFNTLAQLMQNGMLLSLKQRLHAVLTPNN